MPDQLAELNRPMGMHTPAPLTGGSGGPNTSTPIAAGQMSLSPAQFDEPKRAGSGKWIGLAAAVLLLGGGGAFVALRGGPGGAAVATKQPEPSPSGPQAPTLVDPPSAAPAPAPAPVVAPPAPAPVPVAPATIVLTVTDAPAGTDVRDDAGTLLGQVPGKLTLPRGDAPLALHFEHVGDEARVEKVAVGADGQLAIQLHHAKTAKKPSPTIAPTTPASPATPAKPPEKPPAPANPLPDF
jgi:hypothetical protein